MSRPKAPRRPSTPVPPFMVQANREKKQHGINYVTDSRHESLEAARAAAIRLHDQFGRRVRVQDQAEVIWFQLPPLPIPTPRRRKDPTP